MDTPNIHKLDTFDLHSIPDLDIAVLGALELFQQVTLPKIDLGMYNEPLVVGSGNAAATGRIMFADTDSVFGTESTAAEQLASIASIDVVVIVSASGSKHAPILVNAAHAAGKPAVLITDTADSAASKALDTANGDIEYVFPKNREPYTYNTSTYMGMILGRFPEDPATILQFISQHIDVLQFPDFSQYQKYYLIVPPEFEGIIRLLNIKFIELFGRNIARDIETSEYIKHATTIAPAENELFISFGYENTMWGQPEHRLNVPLLEGGGYGAAMAVSYCVVAQIQKAYPHFFKNNIEQYTTDISKVFGSVISPIAEK